MLEADAQTVLRCGRCNKPFDKESTLKRHGYYCRSRKGGNVPRSRSCASCARAKARCDNRRPECSRCLAKSIKCQYPPKISGGAEPEILSGDGTPMQLQKSAPLLPTDSPSISNHQATDQTGDPLFEPTPVMSDLDFTDFKGPYFDQDIDFTYSLYPQANNKGVQYHTLDSSFLDFDLSPSAGSIEQLLKSTDYSNLTIPATPSYTLRSFTARPKAQPGLQRTSNLIFHALKSYPLMMRYDSTPPPFIHPVFVSRNVENKDMEPLTNCIDLVHMLNNRSRGSGKLFWKNVQMECERLCAEHLQLNKWELLTAMQALSLYILIRLDEGETEHNNFDALLVTTITAVATRFNSMDTDVSRNTQLELYDRNLETSWKNWIFEESARRLCVIYQVVNMLVYFEPAAMCNLHQTDLLLAPLPSSKQLWEAQNERAWKAEAERESGALDTAFGLASNGELVRVDEGRQHCNIAPALQSKSVDGTTPTRSIAKWEEWCAGMDGLGGLVMLAASLVA